MKKKHIKHVDRGLIAPGSIESVYQHQDEIAATQQKIYSLSQAIAAQDKEIESARMSIPEFSDCTLQREKLMAEIALGEAEEDALYVLDEQISKARQAFEKCKTAAVPLIDKAKSIHAGLECMQDDAKSKLQHLEKKSAEVRLKFFMREAEETAAEYIAHAHSLDESYRRLRALEILIREQGGKSINGISCEKLYIPLFNLPMFDSLKPHSNAGLGTFYSAIWDGVIHPFSDSAQHEKNHYAVLGVQF